MSLASDLDEIAASISIVAPDQAKRLRSAAQRVRRMQAVLDEIVADVCDVAEASDMLVIAANRRLRVH